MAETPGIESAREVSIRQRDKSNGFRTRKGFPHTFTAGPGVKSYFDISWSYDVDLMEGDYFLPVDTNRKDRLWVEISPNTDLHLLVPGSAIQNDVLVTDTEVVLNVQAKAALNAFLASNGDIRTKEVFFRLTSVPGDPTDFTNLRMANWDADNSKLVSPDGSAFGLTATSGDHLYITMRWEDGTYIAPGEYVRIGDETLGSSSLPAGIVVRFIMQVEDGTALDTYFNMTYLHS